MSWTVREGVALVEQMVLDMMPEGSTAELGPVLYCRDPDCGDEDGVLHVSATIMEFAPIRFVSFTISASEDIALEVERMP